MIRNSIQWLGLAAFVIMATLTVPPSMATPIVFVRGNANSVGIVDQHPLTRGEATYDTTPAATMRYNRRVDVDIVDPARRYDALPDYFNNTNANTRNVSFINGGWYCTPTAALSLVHYWDNDPRFPDLFRAGDTDRSVILEIAGLMDTDDLTMRGGNDPNENHLGTLFADILPGLLGHFNSRYPGQFRGRQRLVGQDGVTIDNLGYDSAILKNIPVLLETRGHTSVGIGFDVEFSRNDMRHYRVNDPWNARPNITAAELGRGRTLPVGAEGVFGISYAEELYGPGAALYDESEHGLSPSGLPFAMHWVEPDDIAAVPEPSTLMLFGIGILGLLGYAGWRHRRQR